jgi:hypothetical protein
MLANWATNMGRTGEKKGSRAAVPVWRKTRFGPIRLRGIEKPFFIKTFLSFQFFIQIHIWTPNDFYTW